MREKAFDFAQDVTKQLIALSTGVVALTVTFLQELTSASHSASLTLLKWGWAFYVVSIAFGLFTLMQLAGHLEKKDEPSIYGGWIRRTSGVQFLAFLAATICTIVFAIRAT